MTNPVIKRALLSVSNKTGLVEFAKNLLSLNIELISTGGTSKLLSEAGILHTRIEEITGLPEMLDGRVKTLHPVIHGGILARRDVHQGELHKLQIPEIDLVVVNFYPFEQQVNAKTAPEAAVEFIDIGGPTMVRAAAKNVAWVSVVIDPADYGLVMQELQQNQQEPSISERTRYYLAHKTFATTAAYDATIEKYFASRLNHDDVTKTEQAVQIQKDFPHEVKFTLKKAIDLRYGENPHQRASAYHFPEFKEGILHAHNRQGKALSYNNILDAEAAWSCVGEFHDTPAAVIVKHANPCGVATGKTIEEAFEAALASDPVSAFGGDVRLVAI